MTDEITDKVSKYLALRIAKEERPEGFFEKTTRMVTLLSSIVALIGVIFSWQVAYEAKQIQTEIDKRQVKINENGNILNLAYHKESIGYSELECATIPIEESNTWIKYRQCILGLEKPIKDDLDFSNVSNQKRVDCLTSKLELNIWGSDENYALGI